MKSIKKVALVLVCLFSKTIISQTYPYVVPNKDYVVNIITGSGLDARGVASAVDYVSGAVYTCGFVNTVSNGKDLILVKFDSAGVQQWVASYDFNSLDDRARGLYVDGSGNVFVTGFSQGTSSGKDIVTIKYNSSGTQQWVARYNGTNNTDDEGYQVLVDGSSNVWVCGYATTASKGKDFQMLKYNSSGTLLSSPKRNGSANADDIAEKMVLSGNNLFVTGTVKNTTTNGDIYTLCLNTVSVTLTWSVSTNGSANGDDTGLDIKLDNGDVYVCGRINNTTTGDDYYFTRLNFNTGATKYSNNYDGGYNGTDYATSMIPDALGNYGVTGIVANGSNTEYHTRLYDTSSVKWTHKQALNGSYTSITPKIATDTIAQHFYVCGTYSNTSLQAMLYQLTPSGTKSWVQYHDGNTSGKDAFLDLVLDGVGRIYLPVSVETSTTSVFDYKLVRYSQTPAYMPVNYNMQADTFSMAHLYYPNNGQIKDTSGSVANEALFYANFSSPKEYILRNKIAFCEIKLDSLDAVNRNDTVSRVDMIFDGANEFSEIFPLDFQNQAILNYFISDTLGITNISGASHLICPNIYPMIDLHFSSNGKGSKYYFVVKPTGDPSVIRLRFDGAVSTTTTSSELKVTSKLSEWTFKKPDIYSVSVPSFTNLTITTTSVTGTNGWVSLGSDSYSINPGTYNTTWPLVIEFDLGKTTGTTSATDNMTWSTYFGGSSETVGYSLVNDNSNNIYIGGYADGTGFPVTVGAYQTSFASGDLRNGVLAKFNSNKSLAWATYYGGGDSDEIDGIEFDNTNSRIYAVGYTFSTNFPLKNKSGASTSPSFHGSGNAADGFLADFTSSTGQLSWSYLIGGNNDDRSIDVKLDGSGNKYIACNGSSGITTLNPGSNYMQSTYGGGFSDGLLCKFSSTDQINWITYYGGSGTDYLHSIATDASNNVFLFGHTNSTNLSTLDPNVAGEVFQSSNGGGFDWFLIKFNSSGQRTWATYYGGSGDEYATRERGVVTISNDAYFFGMTASSGLTTKQYGSSTVQSYAGNNDTYILAINSNYNPIWATYLGGTDVDYSGGITKDASNNIYCTGSTFSSDFPYSIPSNYYAQSYNGASHGSSGWGYEGGDAFISAYSTSRNLVWSTYVGGGGVLHPSGDDIAEGISVSSNNKLYITGGTSSRSPLYPSFNPGTPAFYDSPSTGFGTADIIISEFNVNALPLVGIYENKVQNSPYIVYPNPTSNTINISNVTVKDKIEIYDIEGRKVGSLICANKHEEINLEQLINGIYFIKITSKDGVYKTYKVIKAK